MNKYLCPPGHENSSCFIAIPLPYMLHPEPLNLVTGSYGNRLQHRSEITFIILAEWAAASPALNQAVILRGAKRPEGGKQGIVMLNQLSLLNQ